MIIPFPYLAFVREQNRTHAWREVIATSETIVFTSGTFDLFHAGHVLFLEDCKRQGTILVVGVGSDQAVRGNKGLDRPIMNQAVRMKVVDSCRPVDYTFLEDITMTPGRVGLMLETIFDALKPDRYIINEDAVEMESRQRVCHDMGVQMIALPRKCPLEYGSVSTSSLIEKIVRGDGTNTNLA